MWDLKKNFALIELLERVYSVAVTPSSALKASSSSSSPGDANGASAADAEDETGESSDVRCDENEDHPPASVYCTTCGSHLCAACSASTHATRTLAKHRRIPLAEKPREKHKCPNHTLQVLI